MSSSPLVCLGRRPTGSHRVLCFPYAGGSSWAYSHWPRIFPSNFEIWAAEMPLRGIRLQEAHCEDIKELASDVADSELSTAMTFDIVMGHSMGAIIALEFIWEKMRRGVQLPSLFVASGSPPPRRFIDMGRVHDLSDSAIRGRLSDLSGTSPQILANEELMEYLLPIVRSDFIAMNGYATDVQRPIPLPILVLGGDRDKFVSLEQLASWRELTTRPFFLRRLEGGHFFIHDHPELVRDSILESFGVKSSTI